MRPLQLGLGAFGPYLEPTQIDFRKLGSHQLFLIHGPVGSGKTTLLDAICFALYGSSSGGERTADDMRNDLADENQVTSVVFDFTRGHAQYRVRRDLSKSERGAQFWNLTGLEVPEAWTPPPLPPLLSADKPGWESVTERVTELLGLGESEFRRSILIPQGQFRLLLSAPASEREHILGAIFNGPAQPQLMPLLEHAMTARQEQLRLAWAKREELAAEMHLDSGEDVLERLDQQKKSLLHLEVELMRLQQLQENFVVDAGRSAVYRERSQELSDAKRKLAELYDKDGQLREQKEALSRYQAASLLTDYQTQLLKAEADVIHFEDELANAQSILSNADGSAESPEKSLEDLRASHELQAQLKNELLRVEEGRAVLLAYEQALQERDRQRQLCEQLQEQRAQLRSALQESLERLETLTSSERGVPHSERIRVLQEKISGLQRAQRRSQQQGDVRVSAERLRQYHSKSEQRCQEVEARIQGLEDEISRLRGSNFQAQASFLAAQLEPGRPCLVCGSREHPTPAKGVEEALTAPARGLIDRTRERLSPERLLEQKTLQLKQAQALFKKLESERSEQAITLARLESRLETMEDETQFSAQTPEAVPEETLARLQDELRTLEREASGRGKEENEKLRVQHRLQKLERTDADLQTAFRESEMRLVQKETQVEERQRLLQPGFDSAEKVESKRRDLLEQLREVGEILQGGQSNLIQSTGELAARQAAVQAAERGLEMGRERLRLAREVYEARAEAAGFASLEEVDHSLRNFRGMPEKLHTEIKQHDIDLGAAQNRVERATTLFRESQEELGTAPDLESLQERLETLVGQKAACQKQISELQDRSEEYQHCIEEINRLEPQLSATKRLLRIAGGDNRHKVSFQQFLLAQHMENVLLAANHRLTVMTRGRYTLQPIGKGLELQVLDHTSGQPRPVSTLSGGESFLASLALALGLSDSLATGASAAAVEALFIDEGFGNLDEEALELALQGLLELQQEGRLVGVVSHLAELKERIPARLEVEPGPGGSRASIVIAR